MMVKCYEFIINYFQCDHEYGKVIKDTLKVAPLKAKRTFKQDN